MPQTPDKKGFRERQLLGAEALNKMNNIIPRLVVGSSGDINVNKLGDRISIGMAQDIPTIPESSRLAVFVVREEFPDYLACEMYYQAEDIVQIYDKKLGDDLQFDEWKKDVTVYVAKPYLLQKTPWDGQIIDGQLYSYTNTGKRTVGGVEQTLGSYLPGELIVARFSATGYMVIYPENTPPSTPPTGGGNITLPPVITLPTGPPEPMPPTGPPVITRPNYTGPSINTVVASGNSTGTPSTAKPVPVPIYWQDMNSAGRGFSSPQILNYEQPGIVDLNDQIMGQGTKYFQIIGIGPPGNPGIIYTNPINLNDPIEYFNQLLSNPSAARPLVSYILVGNPSFGNGITTEAIYFINYNTSPYIKDLSTASASFQWQAAFSGVQLVLNGGIDSHGNMMATAGITINGHNGITGTFSIGGRTVTINGGIITGIV